MVRKRGRLADEVYRRELGGADTGTAGATGRAISSVLSERS